MGDLFDIWKVFVKVGDEFKELGTPVQDTTILLRDEGPVFEPFIGTLTFTVRSSKRVRIRLLQQVDSLMRPKTTYRTIKRNCAKRNANY